MAVLKLTDSQLLGRLVAFDTTSTNSNLPIADFICEYLERPGVTIARNPSADGTKVNVIVSAGQRHGNATDAERSQRGGLVLCGHLDVVPAGEEGWNSDAFRLTETNGTYVGRGACDMKGSVALAMNVFASAQLDRLARPLVLLFTYDEELGTLGAQRFAETWPDDQPLPSNVVVGEPTSLQAVRLHKGHLTMRVTVHGKSAHSGSPHLGSNAVETAARVIQGVSRLGDALKRQRCESGRFFPTVPYSVINVVRISGGTAINVIPDRCEFDLGLRLLPGMNSQAMIEWIKDVVSKSDPHVNITVEVVNDSPPLILNERAPIHTTLCRRLNQTQSYGVSFASDAGVLQKLGFECVLFGPGSIQVAHQPNEFVPIDEFNSARDVLEHLVEQFCY